MDSLVLYFNFKSLKLNDFSKVPIRKVKEITREGAGSQFEDHLLSVLTSSD